MSTPTLYEFKERQSGVITFELLDETGAVVPAASLTTATISLYRISTGVIINHRDAQNALNANQVTISSGGVVTWTVQPDDNEILNTDPKTGDEKHRVVFDFTWGAGTKRHWHAIDLRVTADRTIE